MPRSVGLPQPSSDVHEPRARGCRTALRPHPDERRWVRAERTCRGVSYVSCADAAPCSGLLTVLQRRGDLRLGLTVGAGLDVLVAVVDLGHLVDLILGEVLVH